MLRREIFLTGAGASAKGGDVYPAPPPIGDELYAVLSKAYPRSWGALPPNTKALFEANGKFEEAFANIRLENDVLTPVLLSDMARYFLGLRLGPNNALRSLVTKRPDAIYATLNYDLLLEDAAGERPLAYAADFSHPKAMYILKLHGGANIMPDMPLGFGNRIIGCQVNYDGPARPMTRLAAIDRLKFCDDAFAPAMALYCPGKPVLYSPQTTERIQKSFANVAMKSPCIWLIGLRCWSADEHIWGPLAKAPNRLVYVNPSEEHASEFREWALEHRPKLRSDVRAVGFQEFVAGLKGRALKAPSRRT